MSSINRPIVRAEHWGRRVAHLGQLGSCNLLLDSNMHHPGLKPDGQWQRRIENMVSKT